MCLGIPPQQDRFLYDMRLPSVVNLSFCVCLPPQNSCFQYMYSVVASRSLYTHTHAHRRPSLENIRVYIIIFIVCASTNRQYSVGGEGDCCSVSDCMQRNVGKSLKTCHRFCVIFLFVAILTLQFSQ